MRRSLHLNWILFIAAGFAIGCTPTSHPKVTCPVRGSVTLDGKPMEQGEVYFKTDATGELDILPIRQGRFAGRAAPGHRRVEIFAYRETRVPPMPGLEPETTRENYLPAKYNLESTLSADLQSERPNELSFEVTLQ